MNTASETFKGGDEQYLLIRWKINDMKIKENVFCATTDYAGYRSTKHLFLFAYLWPTYPATYVLRSFIPY